MKIKKRLLTFKRSKFVKRIIKLLFIIMSLFPNRKKTIVFESFHGKQFSDNPKALYQYIAMNYPSYKLYWSFDKRYQDNFKHEKLKKLPRFGMKWILVMARAEYWISNSRLPLWIPKPRGTIYVQTWHGTPLKKLGNDIKEVHMPGTDTIKYKKNFTKEAEKWDYLVSPNSYSTEIFKRAFDFKKTVLESGYPRNDVLINDNNKKVVDAIKRNLNIPLDKKVILYAPTWRDNNFYGKGKYKFDIKLDLTKLKKELKDDYVLVLRMHYLVSEDFDLPKHKDFVYDFSNYNDINHLYLISDVLITDYSSVFFDFANLRKPILFFTYDIENYRDELRGFYFNIEDTAPGPHLKTNEEIITYLKLIKSGHYELPEGFESFYEKFCYLEDGKASKRIAESIIS
ncbi:CDP-glycerol glycerophosphotransferase family protein [Virgibacillus halodenitrificans]|uniref:CDP-glycerol glycerophosphotransferase family protein n=1 Tax=Virgibacillus halodenitrificans TaxID=1482 RepID=UPI002DBD5D1F|nr:CDP-glycerol glycerophosphotransferase family protein [Virgibacillus halodenitrificans]MEC2158529.1 CDP-glycerol glycerophosphotransferase family protein [Virgibacillus halodenitrificans]